VLLFTALGFFMMRPAPVLGIDGAALQSSVGNGGSLFDSGPCRKVDDGAWRCERWDRQFSGQISYRVEVDGEGCWDANRVGPPGEGSDKHLSGCLWIFDYLFG
jgi:hypothetical protein